MIEKTVVLACDQARAFYLFTARISEWWPKERRHTSDPESTILLLESGRFFERDKTGQEVELGAVRAWDAPRRLLLDWYPGTGPAQPTRVEILFEPKGAETLVVVQHAATDESFELFPLRAPKYSASWDLVLQSLGKASSSLS